MSFQAMTWAVEQALPARDKLVLLLLANYASNEDGVCYPSIDTLARQCGMARSTVHAALASLAEIGLIEIHKRQIDGTCLSNTYRLCMDAGIRTGGSISGRGVRYPDGGSGRRTGGVRQTDGGGSGRRTGGVRQTDPNQLQEPINRNRSENQTPARERACAEIALPDWLHGETWRAYLEHRRQARKPMSEHAQRLAIRRLDELRSEGHDPRAVIEQSILHGWQGLFPLRQDRGSQDTAETVRRAAEAFARDGGPR
jgi:DNA-binding transcriptional MocR family regulator